MRLQVRGTRLTMPGTLILVFNADTLEPIGEFTSRRIAEDFMLEMAMSGINVFVMFGRIK